jgi:hypothetical protein
MPDHKADDAAKPVAKILVNLSPQSRRLAEIVEAAKADIARKESAA